MLRTPLLAALLLSGITPVGPTSPRTQWKESGYIGSCPARGCMGRRTVCSIYSFPGADGGRNTFYCYLDQ